MTELHPGHFDQSKQWISFNPGIDVVAPDPTAYPVHVLAGDTFMYEIQGGFAEGNQEHFISPPVVYPSSEYWETQLNSDRQRPYLDLSISEYNTLRLPSAIHDYDLYADKGRFYEDVIIDGVLTAGAINVDGGVDMSPDGDITTEGDIECSNIDANEITANVLHNAVTKTRIPIIATTADKTLVDTDTGSVLHCSPAGANLNITLPNDLKTGFVVTITNILPGKTTTLPATLKARGNVLSEQYSAATIYFDGTDWYGYGDLV
jgi:hypothetical protein